MFKNDRMMMILTGLVLAIFAGSMVKYGDKILALMSGETIVASQDDSYSVRSGAAQILDVLSNDTEKGPIVVLSRPSCGAVELTGNNKLSFSSPEACSGEVEFAYCVDSGGDCAPNAVKINVIAVNFTRPDTPAAQAPAEVVDLPPEENEPESVAPADTTFAANTAAPDAADQAPSIANFTVELAPPSLASPSVSELVSPSIAVASIRQQAGGLNTTVNIDQNISTQNSAGVSQSASAALSEFQAPEMGESSNISIGGSERLVAANPAAPSGLQASQTADANIAQLERGPEALASLQASQRAPIPQETAPLATSAEHSDFAPTVVATAHTVSPTPDSSFSAVPIGAGPIALIALQSTDSNTSGESLNLILSEPGLQSFAAPVSLPATLAPTSDRPTEVSVLERAPAASEQAISPAMPGVGSNAAVNVASAQDSAIAQSPLVTIDNSAADSAEFASGATVVGAQPNQSASPNAIAAPESSALSVSVSALSDPLSRASAVAGQTAPNARLFGKPAINLTPAEPPAALQASLSTEAPSAPVITAPAQNSACEIVLQAQSRSGANIQLDILAACKPDQMVTVSHAGIAFSLQTDANGVASTLLPAMQSDVEISALFEDQSSTSTRLTVSSIDTVMRAGVSWQSDLDLDLNAFEYGAGIFTAGHVSAQSPRDYRTSRIKGGGYLVSLGDPALEGGALAEVYTLPVTRNQQRGTIALSVLIGDAAEVCGQTIVAKTSRTRDSRAAGVRNIRFAVPECGTIAGRITLTGAIDDIRVAGR